MVPLGFGFPGIGQRQGRSDLVRQPLGSPAVRGHVGRATSRALRD